LAAHLPSRGLREWRRHEDGPRRSLDHDPAIRRQRGRGSIDRGSLSAAIKLTGRMALGGSLNVWRGAWDDRLSYVESSAEASDFADIRSDNSVRGANVTAGLLFTYPA
jgi:hypothetical protein